MKTVTLPLDEYNQLLQDQKDKLRLMDEIEKDAHDRGYMVRSITNVWEKKNRYYSSVYNYISEKATLNILSKDDVLVKSQEEIERLSKLLEKANATLSFMRDEQTFLYNRGLIKRILNTHYIEEQLDKLKDLYTREA